MDILNECARLLGWALVGAWIVGALGLARFELYFGPARPAPRPVVCKCAGIDQCDLGSGCRVMQKLSNKE